MEQSRISRRGVLGLTGGLAVAGVAGVAGAGLLDGGRVTAGNAGAKVTAAPVKRFAHPGLLHTSADFKRMRTKVRAGAAPWKAGWKVLADNRHSQSGWKPNPQATVYRGGGSPQNYVVLYNDVHAAYQNALRWKVTGERAHGDTARDILNAWSATLKTVAGSADRFLAAGIYGYQFANAAELMRGYPGFDLARFQKMMREVFYPMNDDFLKHHNGALITNYWANWDLTAMCSVLAIGILCDDRAKVQQAVTYFKTGAGNGSIRHAVPFLHPGGLGQWQEAGRDQGHATLGIGLMGTFCEMAWNQGYDLYGYDGNRFLKGAEYVAKYNLGHDVPFTPYVWKSGVAGTHGRTVTQTEVSPSARGIVRPIWALVYNHYVRRRGLHAPYTKAMAAKVRPEGGGGNYGPNSGGFDQLGFGTLAFTR
ncbi:alginate lyase family protein [Actinoallomurus vinaceus]|uniref:Alginate lyase family protein n=1 Tax=Actinoallomurus vinaceus TaxID=1080074 RepID=A0ABP8UMI0_9ACTN